MHEEALWVPIDTAAYSIWADKAWFLRNKGKLTPNGTTAQAVDGRLLKVEGEGLLSLKLWGRSFREKFEC